jgi:hypothetical protein
MPDMPDIRATCPECRAAVLRRGSGKSVFGPRTTTVTVCVAGGLLLAAAEQREIERAVQLCKRYWAEVLISRVGVRGSGDQRDRRTLARLRHLISSEPVPRSP